MTGLRIPGDRNTMACLRVTREIDDPPAISRTVRPAILPKNAIVLFRTLFSSRVMIRLSWEFEQSEKSCHETEDLSPASRCVPAGCFEMTRVKLSWSCERLSTVHTNSTTPPWWEGNVENRPIPAAETGG